MAVPFRLMLFYTGSSRVEEPSPITYSPLFVMLPFISVKLIKILLILP